MKKIFLLIMMISTISSYSQVGIDSLKNLSIFKTDNVKIYIKGIKNKPKYMYILNTSSEDWIIKDSQQKDETMINKKIISPGKIKVFAWEEIRKIDNKFIYFIYNKTNLFKLNLKTLRFTDIYGYLLIRGGFPLFFFIV